MSKVIYAAQVMLFFGAVGFIAGWIFGMAVLGMPALEAIQAGGVAVAVLWGSILIAWAFDKTS